VRLLARHAISPAIVLYRVQEDYIAIRYSSSQVRDHPATRLSAEISRGPRPSTCTVMPVLCALGTRAFCHRTARPAHGVWSWQLQIGRQTKWGSLDGVFFAVFLYHEIESETCQGWLGYVAQSRKFLERDHLLRRSWFGDWRGWIAGHRPL